jgi:hypothetical protein
MGKVNGDSTGGGMVMERSKLEKNDSLVNLNLWQREPGLWICLFGLLLLKSSCSWLTIKKQL